MSTPENVDTLKIAPEIERAFGLPGAAYLDSEYWARQPERVWRRALHANPRPLTDGLTPWSLLPGVLDEQLLLVTRDTETHCVSNVCTHRGAQLVTACKKADSIRCPYHGRRFDLDGRCRHMPEFTAVEGFPSETDDLRRYMCESFGPLLFVALGSRLAYETAPELTWLRQRLGSVATRLEQQAAFGELQLVSSRRYELSANWALYCDNYLEGFHIPFVHPELNQVLDFSRYRTELFEHGSLQVGIADSGEPAESCFELEPGDLDYARAAQGERVAGYYLALFPGTLLNFYPWGLSVNLVQPLGPTRSVVQYLVYVRKGHSRELGAGAELHRVEMQDEQIVEQVQRGIRSQNYGRPRYSPTREQGVHHFHRWLLAALQRP